MDSEMLYLGIGLLILVIVNIVLGSLGALFEHKFDRSRFIQGIVKGAIVVLCFIASYYVGVLNPNIVAVNINGIDMNLLTAVYLIVLAGYYHYAKQVLEKLAVMVSGKLNIQEKEHMKD